MENFLSPCWKLSPARALPRFGGAIMVVWALVHLLPATQVQSASVQSAPTAAPAQPARPTAAPPPGEVHPIVDVERGYLLGGSAHGKWLEARTVAPALPAGASYRLYSLTRSLGRAQGSKPVSAGAPCDETWEVKVGGADPASATPASAPPATGAAIALGANWNARPRPVHRLSSSLPVYRQAVAQVLRQHGLAHPEVRIDQILRVDLNGDGQDEVLITATHYGHQRGAFPHSITPDAHPGDYSLVLLRQVVQGKVRTTMIAGEVHPRFEKFTAPNEFFIAGVLDLNGDGKMEIIVRSQYYEGDATSVYQLGTGNKILNPLSEGCGA